MKVLVIEDEALIAKNLQRLLKQIDPSIEVLAALDSVATSVKWLGENARPDLIFMDIQLADGVSFDIFNKIKIDTPVIFTTAYNEYAIRAFKVNSVDYLLKPIDKEYLERALEKFKKIYGSTGDAMNEQIRQLVSNMQLKDTPKYKERFLVHYKSGMVPVTESQVSYFIKDTIIYLITITGEKLVTDYNTIDEIEEVVDPKRFFRANRQMIIHIDQVDTYKKHDTGKIELQLKCDKNLRIDVSREKANDFKNWIDS
jgi:two-component system LytT family response regulator